MNERITNNNENKQITKNNEPAQFLQNILQDLASSSCESTLNFIKKTFSIESSGETKYMWDVDIQADHHSLETSLKTITKETYLNFNSPSILVIFLKCIFILCNLLFLF